MIYLSLPSTQIMCYIFTLIMRDTISGKSYSMIDPSQLDPCLHTAKLSYSLPIAHCIVDLDQFFKVNYNIVSNDQVADKQHF